MINKKLDEIKASLGVVEELMQDNKYLESLDKDLEKEKHINIDLQQRINKATEYINQLQFAFDFDKDVKRFAFDFLYTEEGKKLLKILKGEDKE